MNPARISLKSIAVLRALNLGGLLFAVPALRALRSVAPGARISLIGLPCAAEFTLRFSRYVDDFIEFPGYPGLLERSVEPAQVARFLRQVQLKRFDLAVQLHGSGRHVNDLIRLFGARRCAGFYERGDECPDPELFVPYPEHGLESERLLQLTSLLGAPQVDARLEFPLVASDRREWSRISREHGLRSGRFVCVHAGAPWRSRRWPADRFAAVADALSARGLKVALTGSQSERPVAALVAAAMRSRPADLTGRTSLGGLAAVVSECRLLVCNDTGISHIAAALGVPSVVVVSGSQAPRWRPRGAALRRVVSAVVDCRPCSYETCPIGHPCALRVNERRVISAALETLEKSKLA